MSSLGGPSTLKMEEWEGGSAIAQEATPMPSGGTRAQRTLGRGGCALQGLSEVGGGPNPTSQKARAMVLLRNRGSLDCQISHVLVRVVGK